MGLPSHIPTQRKLRLSSLHLLQPDPNGEPFDQPWSYRSIIGKLNFLEKSTRPDLAYAVHQCARFTADPRKSHGEAVKRIVRYLIGTADKGFLLSPNEHSFECWADADYAGNWCRDFAMEDIGTARSRSGYLITYAGCLMRLRSALRKLSTLRCLPLYAK